MNYNDILEFLKSNEVTVEYFAHETIVQVPSTFEPSEELKELRDRRIATRKA